MINRIIHFSDLHLKLFKDHDLYREILNQGFKEWASINPDRIVFTGDLVHSKNQLTPELIEMVRWVLTSCSEIAKTIIIPGNHDALINNTERLDSLTPIISSLNNPNIVYYKDRGVYEDDNVRWCVYSQFQGNIPPDIHLAQGYKIGLFHGPINGLKTDLGFDFGEEAYDTNKFEGLDIVLCGDIHKRATFTIPNGKKGIMIGSTIQNNMGENIRNHGYGIFEIDTYQYNFVDLPNPKPFLNFRINGIEDLEKGTERLVNY
jgi:DNA repair exonuclease SbcCD nuclease subunit